MTDWYTRNVEEPVRDLVRHLRNNGINTECSCGHEMTIQCQMIPDGTFGALHDLVFEFLAERRLPVTYRIVAELECREQSWRATCRVYLERT